LQPADVGWFKTLKNDYKNDWNAWFQGDESKEVTRYGNICGPGYQRMISWIVKGWTNLEKIDIARSFEYCGITSSNPDDYHKILRDILATKVAPPNVSIEVKEKDEEIFGDVFITNTVDDNECDENYVRITDEDSFSDTSVISSIYSDNGEELEYFQSPISTPVLNKSSKHTTPVSSNSSIQITPVLNKSSKKTTPVSSNSSIQITSTSSSSITRSAINSHSSRNITPVLVQLATNSITSPSSNAGSTSQSKEIKQKT
jgi:hypothetical protein